MEWAVALEETVRPAYLRCVLALDHLVLAACGLWLALAAAPAPAAELWIGAATADITPDRPVPLTGNTSVRIGREIQSRLTANILAEEASSEFPAAAAATEAARNERRDTCVMAGFLSVA